MMLVATAGVAATEGRVVRFDRRRVNRHSGDEWLVVVATGSNDNNKRKVTKGVKGFYQYRVDQVDT
jgi:hypothetical protein